MTLTNLKISQTSISNQIGQIEKIVSSGVIGKMDTTRAGLNGWQLAKMKKSIPDMSLP